MKKRGLLGIMLGCAVLAGSSAAACSCSLSLCTVTFDTNGGNEIAPVQVKKNSTISKPRAKKNGYDLSCWKLGDKEWNFTIDLVKKDITLVANWNIKHYEISYEYNQDFFENDSRNPSTYTVEDEITIYNAITKYENSFDNVHWVDEKFAVVTKINKGTTGNIKLRTMSNPKAYELSSSIDNTELAYGVSRNGSTLFGTSVDFRAVVYNTDYEVVRLHETVSDTYYEGNEVQFMMPAHDVHFVIETRKAYYNVYLSSDLTATLRGSGKYKVGSEVTVTCKFNLDKVSVEKWADLTTKEEYGSGDQISFIMPAHDVNLVAYANNPSYTITYVDEHSATNSNPTSYTRTDKVTLSDLEHNEYWFQGWYDEDDNKVTELGSGTGYLRDITLTAKWETRYYTIILESDSKFFVPDFNCLDYTYGTKVNVGLTQTGGKGKVEFVCWYTVDYKTKAKTIYTTEQSFTYTLTESIRLYVGYVNVNCGTLVETGSRQTTEKYFHNGVIQDEIYTEEYDINGNLTSKGYGDESTTTKYEYDSNNRVIKETCGGTSGVVTTYEYNTNGSLSKKSEQTGSNSPIVYLYNYDASNKLTMITKDGVDYIEYLYSDSIVGYHLVEECYLDSNYSILSKYDLDYKLVERTTKSSGNIVSVYSYEYDIDGNNTKLTQTYTGGITLTYVRTYNENNQIVTENYTGSTETDHYSRYYTYYSDGRNKKTITIYDELTLVANELTQKIDVIYYIHGF